MELGKRYEFHSHTLLSDGELLISEHVRRAEKLGFEVIGITDHADITNIDTILENMYKFIEKESKYYKVKVIPGVELTHVPPEMIDELAKYAKDKGAKLVIVHGETIVEPVEKGTNYYAVNSKYVDILAHPGIISSEEVKAAAANGIFLEISARKGHSLGNGRVVSLAREYGAELILNTDAHSPSDFISQQFAFEVARGAGLSEEEALKVISKNPLKLLEKIKI